MTESRGRFVGNNAGPRELFPEQVNRVHHHHHNRVIEVLEFIVLVYSLVVIAHNRQQQYV